jgi:hypothetical protein
MCSPIWLRRSGALRTPASSPPDVLADLAAA